MVCLACLVHLIAEPSTLLNRSRWGWGGQGLPTAPALSQIYLSSPSSHRSSGNPVLQMAPTIALLGNNKKSGAVLLEMDQEIIVLRLTQSGMEL